MNNRDFNIYQNNRDYDLQNTVWPWYRLLSNPGTQYSLTLVYNTVYPEYRMLFNLVENTVQPWYRKLYNPGGINNVMFSHLRVAALIFVFVAHEEEEGIHPWDTKHIINVNEYLTIIPQGRMGCDSES